MSFSSVQNHNGKTEESAGKIKKRNKVGRKFTSYNKKMVLRFAPGFATLPLGLGVGVYRRQRHHFSAVVQHIATWEKV